MVGMMTIHFDFNLDEEDAQAIEDGTMTPQDLDWQYYMDKYMSADLETIEVL